MALVYLNEHWTHLQILERYFGRKLILQEIIKKYWYEMSSYAIIQKLVNSVQNRVYFNQS